MSDTPEQLSLFSVLARAVRTVLPSRDRAAIKAARMDADGLNHRDIAEAIGCSVVDVPARIRRGNALLEKE